MGLLVAAASLLERLDHVMCLRAVMHDFHMHVRFETCGVDLHVACIHRAFYTSLSISVSFALVNEYQLVEMSTQNDPFLSVGS